MINYQFSGLFRNHDLVNTHILLLSLLPLGRTAGRPKSGQICPRPFYLPLISLHNQQLLLVKLIDLPQSLLQSFLHDIGLLLHQLGLLPVFIDQLVNLLVLVLDRVDHVLVVRDLLVVQVCEFLLFQVQLVGDRVEMVAEVLEPLELED